MEYAVQRALCLAVFCLVGCSVQSARGPRVDSSALSLANATIRPHDTAGHSDVIPIIYSKMAKHLSPQSETVLRRLAVEKRPDTMRQELWFIFYHKALEGRADVVCRPDRASARVRKGVMFQLFFSEGDATADDPLLGVEDYLQIAPKNHPFPDRLGVPKPSVIWELPVRLVDWQIVDGQVVTECPRSRISEDDAISIVDQIREHADDLDEGESLIEIPSLDSSPTHLDIQFNYESTTGDSVSFHGGPGHYRWGGNSVWAW